MTTTATRARVRGVKAAMLALVPGKLCWTCGERKNEVDFNADPTQYDGLRAECRRCEEYRELARRMDGETGPRDYPIDGEGRTSEPVPSFETAMYEHVLTASLRARPTSGLMSMEV